jgi:hypothetical protein
MDATPSIVKAIVSKIGIVSGQAALSTSPRSKRRSNPSLGQLPRSFPVAVLLEARSPLKLSELT